MMIQSAKKALKWLKAFLRDACWEAYGLVIKKPVLKARPQFIVFICKGNVCRSPFAERYARTFAKDRSIIFLSAGLKVSRPNPPPETALSAAKRCGVDMEDHRSQPLTPEMMQKADAVIVMEISQLRQLKRHYPARSEIIYPLALFESRGAFPGKGFEKYNIKDPYGGSVEEFTRCYHRISRCFDHLMRNAQTNFTEVHLSRKVS